ncbi:flavin reductase family protein [Saccharothrix deserti]|uniref:flavin reductase family protein n=1 Tax=Saccharothrix deserti TaxID=2593674 RepID=UPI001EE4BA74|nr:flavin reductase family protein [Saccharothrix deserti]
MSDDDGIGALAVREDVPLRTAMARFASGVTVLTVAGKRVHGMTANAFSSVSLDPPLVLCCVAHSAVMHDAVVEAGHFAVSIAAAGQQAVASHFADKARPDGLAQFEGIGWAPGPHTGAPLLTGAVAWLECALVESHVAGDHTIFIGAVLQSTCGPDREPLLYFDGGYRRVST